MILFVLALCFVPVFIASGRGAQSPWMMFVLSFFLTPIVGIIVSLAYPFEGRKRAEKLGQAALNKYESGSEHRAAKRKKEEDELLDEWGEDD